MVYEFIPLHCRYPTQINTYENYHRCRKEAKFQGGGEKVKKSFQDGAPCCPGPAKVSLENLRDPPEVLHINGSIQSMLGYYSLDITQLFYIGNENRCPLLGRKKCQN
jgi:hypothetical protein